MTRTIALTGATGFIGSVLQRRLAQQGFHLRALSRRPCAAVAGVEWIIGSLEDEAALAQLVAGADSVIHCAGAVRGATADAFIRSNVDGSRQLAAAARQGNCRRFLLLSSLAARHPELSWYAASKREAEHQVSAAAGNVALTVFRPTAVYGPGDREMRPLLEWLLRGWLLIPGDAAARLSFLHVDDLAEAVVGWLAAPEPPTGVFELDDGQPNGYGWAAIAATGERLRGGPVRRVTVPRHLLTGLAHGNLLLSRLLGRAPMLTPAKLRELRHPDWTCNNAPLQRVLNWAPRLQLEQALRERRF